MFIDETRDWAGGESGPSRKSTQIRTGFWGILGVDSLSVEVGRRSTCVGGVSAIDGARAPTCRLCCTGVQHTIVANYSVWLEVGLYWIQYAAVIAT